VVSTVIDHITEWIGHPAASVLAVLTAVADLILGWRAGFSSTWINGNSAATGLIAILLLFLLQHSTNRGNRALQAKLDAQIAVDTAVDNRLIGSEQLSAVEIKRLQEEAVTQVQEKADEAADS
jgi:low affinity Fe/Cu permease